MVRAIMEGVVYSLRESLEIIEELGVPIHEIRTIGGGAKSDLWRQIQADGFGKSVTTVKSENGAAYGAALLAAVGAGGFKSVEEASEATTNLGSKTQVNKKAAALYEKAFPVYQELYSALKDSFKKIAAIEGSRAAAEYELV